MLHIRTIFFHILAKLLGYGGIALEQILARHAGLTGGTARIYYIGRILQSLTDV
jgi:hypothetical protein